jgi:hypothetical protein
MLEKPIEQLKYSDQGRQLVNYRLIHRIIEM